ADPAAGLVPPAFAGALPKSDASTQNLAKAKDLVAESGIDSPTIKFVYPSITYRGVDLGTIATKVAGDAKKAGITLKLTPQPLTTFLNSERDGKAEMVFTPQSLNYPVAASMVNNMAPGKSTALRAGWTTARANPRAIAAGKQVTAATDSEARAQAMQHWQQMMKRYSPFITLAYNSGVVVATSKLRGATYSPAGWLVDIASVGRA
ncbi:MAG: ABC transporter substrate-binding protein, partial [Nocardioidaceae bacterium]